MIAGITNPDLQRLQRFTHGFYRLKVDDQQRVVLSDLRMGGEPHYVFNFALAQVDNSWQIKPIATEQISATRPSLRELGWIYRRIYTSSDALPPMQSR